MRFLIKTWQRNENAFPYMVKYVFRINPLQNFEEKNLLRLYSVVQKNK